MPVLEAFYNKGQIRMSLRANDIYEAFYSYYWRGINSKDLKRDKSTRDYLNWKKEDYLKLARRNPINYLIKSDKGLFIKEEAYEISLNSQLKEYTTNKAFIYHMKDIIEYRTLDYYKSRYEEDL